MSVTAPFVFWCIVSLCSAAAAQPTTITPAATAEVARITGNGVRVRSQPTTGSTIVARLNQGDEVVVLERITRQHPMQNEPREWCKVALPVWVSSRYLDPATRSVRATRVNLRSGPGVNHPILGTITHGTVVQTLETHGEWSRLQGASGFIAAYLLKTPTPPPNPQPIQQPELPKVAQRLEEPRPVITSPIPDPSPQASEEAQQPAPLLTAPAPSSPAVETIAATDNPASTLQAAATTVLPDPEESQPAPEPAKPEPEAAEALPNIAPDMPVLTPATLPSHDPDNNEVTSALPTLEGPDLVAALHLLRAVQSAETSRAPLKPMAPADTELLPAPQTHQAPKSTSEAESARMNPEVEEQARMILREKLAESGTNAVAPAKMKGRRLRSAR